MMTLPVTILYIFCAVITATIGILSVIKDSKSDANRAYAYFTLSVLLWMIAMYFGYYYVNIDNPKSLFFIRYAYAFSIFLGLTLSMFFYSYPRVTLKIAKPIKILVVISAFVLAALSLTPLVHESQVIEDGIYVADKFGPLYGLYTMYFFAHLIFATLLGTKKIFSTRGIEKTKIMMAAFGCWVFLFFGVMTNVLLPLFDIFIFQMESVAFTLFFSIPAFYSMQKYRFFDISFKALNSIRKLILATAFIFAVLIPYQILPNVFEEITNLTNLVISSLIGIFLFKKIEKIFPELMNKSYRAFKEITQELHSELYQCNTYFELVTKIEAALVLRLHLSNARILLVREKQTKTNIPIYLKDDFTKEIEASKKELIVAEELETENKKENKKIIEKMESIQASICIPLYLEKNLIGLFILGNKPKKEPYTQEEIEEVIKLKNAVEIAFTNILFRSDLKDENDLMKNIIKKKTKNLRTQNSKIKKLLRQQSDFIAVTAHEFRTPINIAMLQLEDTLDSHEHNPDVKKDIITVESALTQLKNLTQQLFDVQQYDLDKVKPKKEDIEINTFIKDVFIEMKEIIRSKHIDFTLNNNIDAKTTAHFDETLIRQVIHNLITNAYKFTPEKGKIQISTWNEDGNITISIADSGSGISNEEKERIFEKFQTTNTNMSTGIGMGLYICKKILKLHKGSIDVKDSQFGGAEFYIELPIQTLDKTNKDLGRSVDLNKVSISS